MNSLYTLGTRQTNSLSADLERLRNGDNSASLLGLYSSPLSSPPLIHLPSLGQISASLAAMQRTIEDYDAVIKREIIKAKQEKGQMYVFPCTLFASSPPCRRVQKFRADYADLKSQFEHIKNEVLPPSPSLLLATACPTESRLPAKRTPSRCTIGHSFTLCIRCTKTLCTNEPVERSLVFTTLRVSFPNANTTLKLHPTRAPCTS